MKSNPAAFLKFFLGFLKVPVHWGPATLRSGDETDLISRHLLGTVWEMLERCTPHHPHSRMGLPGRIPSMWKFSCAWEAPLIRIFFQNASAPEENDIVSYCYAIGPSFVIHLFTPHIFARVINAWQCAMNQEGSANKVLTVLMPCIPQSSGETEIGQATTSKCNECKGFTRKSSEGLVVWPWNSEWSGSLCVSPQCYGKPS